MPERKMWTEEEDRVLRHLVEDRGITRWADLPRVMEEEYGLAGRNGKQCRQRYHNHLAKNISNAEWSKAEENLMFEMQNEVGNKWALISGRLPGRTDNQVKNHFYSKLRKGLRKLNKKIHHHLKRQFKKVKTSTLYRVIEGIQVKNKSGAHFEQETYELCKRIKDRLRDYEQQDPKQQTQELTIVRQIIQDFVTFDKDIRRVSRKATLKGSENLFGSDTLRKTEANFVTSTNSNYDQDSESLSNYSNSDLYSSASLGKRNQHTLSLHRSARLETLRKSHNSIKSQKQDDYCSDQEEEDKPKGLFLYKSDQMLRTDRQLMKSAQCLHVFPVITPNQLKKEHSEGSLGSNNSMKNEQIRIDDLNSGMFDEESPQIRIMDLKEPTFEEKMEIHFESNDMDFGQMNLEEQLVKDFSGLAMVSIPKLGQDIDWQ